MSEPLDLTHDPRVLAAFTLVQARESETRRRLRAFIAARQAAGPQPVIENDWVDQMVDEIRWEPADDEAVTDDEIDRWLTDDEWDGAA